TVVEDLGASFIQVSGNTGDAIGVGISEWKRLTTIPQGLDLAIANKTLTQKDRDDASANIKQAQFPDVPYALTYSITRYSEPFTALNDLNDMTPKNEAAVLRRLWLRRVRQPTPST